MDKSNEGSIARSRPRRSAKKPKAVYTPDPDTRFVDDMGENESDDYMEVSEEEDFSDISEDESDDETEDENLTKQGYSKSDGFVVDDSDIEEDEDDDYEEEVYSDTETDSDDIISLDDEELSDES